MASFENTYARLPERFYARISPTRVREPRLIELNHALVEQLGLEGSPLLELDALAGNRLPEGAEPIALAYAGHQFGTFVPQLGDGRAILLGELLDREGRRRDLQLKGSGRTPFSRGGDGRAALGPVLREYLLSEAMAALGIPTTRALAAVETGEPVYREEALPGALLARVASSHLRVGTFEFFASRRDTEALQILIRYALERHYPARLGAEEGEALALLDGVIEAQASLVAAWLGVGFVHGVMNTDNSSISGETIDYGPCAFLDEYDPAKRFSSIDHGGRYAFSNQPSMALFNLARLAEALMPCIAEDAEEAAGLAGERLERFAPRFEAAYGRVFGQKLGLSRLDRAQGDGELLEELLSRLARHEIDFTLFFRRLCASAEDAGADAEIASLFRQAGVFEPWAERWRRRLGREPDAGASAAARMRQANPARIPRNHRVEEAIVAASLHRDFGPFRAMLAALSSPYEEDEAHAFLLTPPRPEERVQRTFCGT
ncbi:MAG: YdiU family protein [Myxococcales bacterium]|nr:YdiU family protein [Myxococcales bacterium]